MHAYNLINILSYEEHYLQGLILFDAVEVQENFGRT
jgi:hypothetical protein